MWFYPEVATAILMHKRYSEYCQVYYNEFHSEFFPISSMVSSVFGRYNHGDVGFPHLPNAGRIFSSCSSSVFPRPLHHFRQEENIDHPMESYSIRVCLRIIHIPLQNIQPPIFSLWREQVNRHSGQPMKNNSIAHHVSHRSRTSQSTGDKDSEHESLLL